MRMSIPNSENHARQWEPPSSPGFLIKSSLGVTLVLTVILVPFSITNFMNNQISMGLATASVAIACSVNALLSYRGRYNMVFNTYLLVPLTIFLVTYTLIKLAAPGSYWPYLLVLGYYFVLPEKRALFFNILTILILTPVALTVLEPPSAVRFTAVLLGTSLFAYNSMREIYALQGRLKEQAVRDDLTGLYNRSLLEDSLQRAVTRNQRTGVPMTMLIFDIDHFKSINDTRGHHTGDLVLRGFGDLLRKSIRKSDMAFRIGGEEFLILFHNANEERSTDVAEKLRREVELTAFLPDCEVTISAGVSGLREGMDVAVWMKECDNKLYRAKEGGRNRVVV